MNRSKKNAGKNVSALSSDNILKTAYILAGMIILAVLVVVLISVVAGRGQDRNTVQAAGGLDYAASQVTVWGGEGVPAAEIFLNDNTRPMVTAVRYLLVPNTEVGDQDIAILMQLEDGTTRTENAVLTIREPVIHWELGSDTAPELLLGSGYENAEFSEPIESFTKIGSYPITVTNDDAELEFTLVVQDTVPPVAEFYEDLNFFVNQKLTAKDFVKSCNDMSAVEYHFSENPSTLTEGVKYIQMIVTDAAGNSRTYDLAYMVSGDGEPPELEGIKDMKTIAGIPVDYLRGVKAIDANDGEVAVTAEAPEGFSIRQAGTYTITYSTVDKTGNERTETAKLEVLESLSQLEELSEDDIYRMGDYVINQLKETNDFTKKKEFAQAIYTYVQSHMFYHENHNIVDWQYAAATALYQGYGDCRNYYALSRLLLTCADYDNMMVEKVKTNDWEAAHFWNLVKVNGAWYHFDATPRNNASNFFLWTDAKMDAYSARNGNCFNRDKSLYPPTPES